MAKAKTEKTVFTLNGFQIFDLKKQKDGSYTGTIADKEVVWDAAGRCNPTHPEPEDLNLETIQ